MTATLHRAVAADPAPAADRAVPPPPLRPVRSSATALVLAARSVSLIALVGVGFLGYLAGLSGLQEQRTQDTLYASFRSQLATATAPVSAPIPEGVAVAVIEVPRLHLRQVVIEGTASADLMRGPGHRRDTVLPGQPGVSVVIARRAAFGGPFARLGELRPGDEVGVVTGLGRATYAVASVRTTGTAPATELPANRLSLVTSDPAWQATRGLVVTARLRSDPLPGPSARPAIRGDERSGSGESGALLPLVLWAQALLLIAAVTAWAYAGWGSRWSAYLLTTPAVLAVLWNVYDNLARLLPNTL